MRLIRIRPWYVASIVLGLAAIWIDFASKRAATAGMIGMAKATQAIADGVPLEVRESMKQESMSGAHRADALTFIGLGVAAASVVCLCVSISKYESGWKPIPVAVLIVYGFSLLLTV